MNKKRKSELLLLCGLGLLALFASKRTRAFALSTVGALITKRHNETLETIEDEKRQPNPKKAVEKKIESPFDLNLH